MSVRPARPADRTSDPSAPPRRGVPLNAPAHQPAGRLRFARLASAPAPVLRPVRPSPCGTVFPPRSPSRAGRPPLRRAHCRLLPRPSGVRNPAAPPCARRLPQGPAHSRVSGAAGRSTPPAVAPLPLPRRPGHGGHRPCHRRGPRPPARPRPPAGLASATPPPAAPAAGMGCRRHPRAWPSSSPPASAGPHPSVPTMLPLPCPRFRRLHPAAPASSAAWPVRPGPCGPWCPARAALRPRHAAPRPRPRGVGPGLAVAARAARAPDRGMLLRARRHSRCRPGRPPRCGAFRAPPAPCSSGSCHRPHPCSLPDIATVLAAFGVRSWPPTSRAAPTPPVAKCRGQRPQLPLLRRRRWSPVTGPRRSRPRTLSLPSAHPPGGRPVPPGGLPSLGASRWMSQPRR